VRLFAAVDLAPAAVEEAVRVIDQLKCSRPPLDVRWVPPTNMHLTVRFIGHVPDEVAPALIDSVTRPLAEPAFAITLNGCGAFPPSGSPRVLWIGLGAGADALARISVELDARVVPFGYGAEARPFSAHLTLARAARGVRLPRDLRERLARILVRPVETRVSAAVLYQSHLSPKGARYEPVGRIPLRQEAR
jgi:2'-5' RNA ligase